MVRCQAPAMRHQHCYVGEKRAGCGLGASWGQLAAKRAGWMQAWRKLEGSCRPAAGKLELDTRCRKVWWEQANRLYESCTNDCGKLGARFREAPGSRTMSPGRGSDRTCDAQRSEKYPWESRGRSTEICAPIKQTPVDGAFPSAHHAPPILARRPTNKHVAPLHGALPSAYNAPPTLTYTRAAAWMWLCSKLGASRR